MGKTAIEWTDESVNIILARREGSAATKGGYSSGVGHYCEKVSPGCKNCYSSATQPRFGLPLFQEQRRGGIESFFNAERARAVLSRKKPTRFFWHDMTDMFGSWVPNELIAACFGIMAATPQHTHQILTKRAARLPEWFAWAAKRGEDGARLFPDDDRDWRIRQMCHVEARLRGVDLNADRHQNHGGPWPLPNVHLGVSVEDQQRADELIPLLLQTPAAVRFISAEPLLGEVKFREEWLHGRFLECPDENKPDGADGVDPCMGCDGFPRTGQTGGDPCGAKRGPALSWVIVGGESGPGARPFDVLWARSLLEQCKAAGVPAFMKQIGADPVHLGGYSVRDKKGGDMAEWPDDLRVREFPEIAS
jgi:protein gp37